MGAYTPVLFKQSKQAREYIPWCLTNQSSKGSIYRGACPVGDRLQAPPPPSAPPPSRSLPGSRFCAATGREGVRRGSGGGQEGVRRGSGGSSMVTTDRDVVQHLVRRGSGGGQEGSEGVCRRYVCVTPRCVAVTLAARSCLGGVMLVSHQPRAASVTATHLGVTHT
eukprot:477618-Prorocentrum_minimum.AAC.1